MPLRETLDLPWEQFVSHWCFGVFPEAPESQVKAGLEALERHWPDQLNKIEAGGTRGIIPILWASYLGNCLRRSESLEGFAEVFARARSGEASALSEIGCAAALTILGLSPRFGPHVGTRRLDLAVAFSERHHFIEVVRPEHSAAIEEARSYIQRVTQALFATAPGIAVRLLVRTDDQAPEAVARAVTAAPYDEAPQEIGGALLTKVPTLRVQSGIAIPPSPPPLGFTPTSPVIFLSSFEVRNGVLTAVEVHFPISDQRAKRIVNDERRHFKHGDSNLLVIDISHVVGGAWNWEELVRRCLQPRQNTRIGAVLLWDYSASASPPCIVQHWKVLPNPYARVPVSVALIEQLGKLNAW